MRFRCVMPNAMPRLSLDGRCFIVQTENPTSATLFETRNFLPRNQQTGYALTQHYGGQWRYVRGHGCRGAWTAYAESPAELAALMQRVGIPIVLFLYPGKDAPDVLRFVASQAFALQDGYYCEDVSENLPAWS